MATRGLILFMGSVYFNLYATSQSTREDAWNTISTTSPVLATKPSNLQGMDTVLTEDGRSLSAGKRKLFCLARALLQIPQRTLGA